MPFITAAFQPDKSLGVYLLDIASPYWMNFNDSCSFNMPDG